MIGVRHRNGRAREVEGEAGGDEVHGHAVRGVPRATALALEQVHRIALVLQQFSGMSIQDIAVVTGAEAETVKSRLRYAMQKLRAGLDSAAGAGGQA